MPILATVERLPVMPQAPADEPPCRIDFRSLDGSEWIQCDGSEWINQARLYGVDSPPREVVRDRVPGLPGSRLRQINDLEREVIVPLMVRPQSRTCRAVREALARLRRAADYRRVDYAAAEGHMDLVATSGSGVVRTLRVSLLEGMEGTYEGRGPGWAVFALRFVAHDPYWHGEDWTTPVVRIPESDPFLSTNPAHVWPRRLSPSVALGADMPVEVKGDIPSAPSVEIVGAASSTLITSSTGLHVAVGAIPSGQTFRLATYRTVSATLQGAQAWDLLGSAPVWMPLMPGDATISVVAQDATPSTAARVYGPSLYEAAFG